MKVSKQGEPQNLKRMSLQPTVLPSSSYDSFRSVDPNNEILINSRAKSNSGSNSENYVEVTTEKSTERELEPTLTNFPYNIMKEQTSNSKQNSVEESKPLVPQDLPYSCFTKWRVITIFMIIVYIAFLGPMSGNIYIPALPLLQNVFNVSSTVINSTVSVFMAVFSVGPLFWGSFADLGGRKILYLVSLFMMLVVNILLAVVPTNIAALFVLRIFQAFASSSVMSLGAGTVTDLTKPEHRGKAIGYFMMGPNMGPILAPIIAGLILIDDNRWRWLFGFTSITCGVGLFAVLIFLPETLRCKIGNGDPGWKTVKQNDPEEFNPEGPILNPQKAKWTFFSDIIYLKPVSDSSHFKELYPSPPKVNLKLYWNMLTILPVTMTSISTALLFANYYAFSVTFSHFLQERYHFSMLGIGAAYVCPGVAMLVGSQSGGHLSDYLRSKWLKANEGKQFPLELRLVLQVWGILFNTIGCIGYGWAIHKHYPIEVVFVFSAFIAFGLTWCSNTTMTYLTELLSRRAAGTVALSSFFRNIAAAISSAVIIKFTDLIGVGWSFTILGLINIISLIFNWYLIRYSGLWQNKVKNI